LFEIKVDFLSLRTIFLLCRRFNAGASYQGHHSRTPPRCRLALLFVDAALFARVNFQQINTGKHS
jgi:hypothetical protein